MPWATRPSVQEAADAFGASASPSDRAALLQALPVAGCTDRAVLGALDAGAGELRAAVMTELLLGTEPGALIRASRTTESTRPPLRYHARVHLPVPSRDTPRDGGLADQLKPHLNAALRAAGLGSTQHGPMRLGRLDDTWVDEIPLTLVDDWRAGLRAVRDVLLRAGVPEGTSVKVTRRGETVKAGMDQELPCK